MHSKKIQFGLIYSSCHKQTVHFQGKHSLRLTIFSFLGHQNAAVTFYCHTLFIATHYATFRTSRITNQQLCSRSSKNLISQVAPFSSSYHEIFITVWGQHQWNDDLVTEQWGLFMLQDLVQSVQLSRQQGKAVQDRGPGGGKKVSECSK